MLSARVKPKKLKFEDRYLFMVYDVKTAKSYKKMTGKSLMSAMAGINKEADELELAEIMACCLREEPRGECLTLDYFEEYNPIAIVTMFIDDFKEQILQGLDEKALKQKADKLKSQNYRNRCNNGYKKKN